MIKLSTIVANYNYAHFLEEALLSILKQEGPYEVLIIDDASTDGSRDLIVEFAKKFPQVRYHFKEKNEGVEEAFNTGLQLAQGEYVHLFASDDLYLPNSLALIFEHVDRFPTAPLFCSDFAYFSDSSTIEIKKQLPQSSHFSFFSPAEVFKLFQTTRFWIPGHTVIAKKCLYTPLEKPLGSVSDWLIHHTIALKEGVGYIPKGLIAMRQHAYNYSSSFSAEKKRRVWLYLLDTLEKNPDKYDELYRSGILRMLGVRTIFKDLLTTPRYWKYLSPMIKRELLKISKITG